MSNPFASTDKSIIFFKILDIAEDIYSSALEADDENYVGSSYVLAKDLGNQFTLVRMLATNYPGKTLVIEDPLQKLNLFNHIIEEVNNLQIGLYGLSDLNSNEKISIHAKAAGRLMFGLINMMTEWQSMWMRRLPIDTSLLWQHTERHPGSGDALRKELSGKKAIIPRRSFIRKYFCK